MPIPDFLYIGPDKAGSTWFYEYCRGHPDIYVPIAKDLYYFDRYYRKGQEWYAAFFSGAASTQRVGEISHDYLYSSEAATRIQHDLPTATLLAFLREPVSRAVSHYLYLRRSGMTELPFRDAIYEIAEITEHSKYGKYIERYRWALERGVLACMDFEELIESPLLFQERLCCTLGVRFMTVDVPRERRREATVARSMLMSRLMKMGARAFRAAGWANAVGRMKHSGLTRWLYRRPTKAEVSHIGREDKELVAGMLESDARKLHSLLGEQSPLWLRRRLGQVEGMEAASSGSAG